MELKTPDMDYPIPEAPKQDAIMDTEMKRKAHWIAKMRRLREDIFVTCSDTDSPRLKVECWDLLVDLYRREMAVFEESP